MKKKLLNILCKIIIKKYDIYYRNSEGKDLLA